MIRLTSNLSYGKTLITSSVEGARASCATTLDGERVGGLLTRSARNSRIPAAIGLGLGILVGCLATRHKRDRAKVLTYGLAGGALGFSMGMAWETRSLTGGVVRGAIKDLDTARNDHWLATHPINYG